MTARIPGLVSLARLHGVQASYNDAAGRRQTARDESVMAILRAVGAPVEGPADVPAALDALGAEEPPGIEPVIVAWDGLCPDVPVRAPDTLDAHLGPGDPSTPDTTDVSLSWKRVAAGAWAVRIAGVLPSGYYRLHVAWAGGDAESLVVSAPARAYTGGGERSWGVFLPLYAVRTCRDWGTGDLTSLRDLLRWSTDLGASVVATLPLLASYLDRPFEPSPYSPVSRLFWNDFYLDPAAAPEFQTSQEARSLVSCDEFQRSLAELRARDRVAYRRIHALKRRVLQSMAADLARRRSSRWEEFRRFVDRRPELEEYAAFRATMDVRRQPWQSWPDSAPDEQPPVDDCTEDSRHYHRYVQFLADEQLRAVSQVAGNRNATLMLDLPLGVNAAGYDTWSERDSFAGGLSCGAPPDSFFTLGQSWGFPPAHPEGARLTGYRYFRASLRNLMRYAGVLRIDHIAGLHRMFCIPDGMEPRDGTYVRYRPEELYAIISLESHRHRTIVVGEDLGTVPRYVRRAMARHAVHGTYVLQYEATPATRPAPAPALSVSSLNTHDMPTFSGFWQGLDVADRQDLGLLDERQAAAERADRQSIRQNILSSLPTQPRALSSGADSTGVAGDILAQMAAGKARLLLVNLEDLWGETAPQNVPGTTMERSNWRRKARYSLEELEQDRAAVSTLSAVNKARRGASQT